MVTPQHSLVRSEDPDVNKKAEFPKRSFMKHLGFIYEGWNFNSGNYLFTTDTK